MEWGVGLPGSYKVDGDSKAQAITTGPGTPKSEGLGFRV